ncbi:MAG TPA: hypothetical protein ENG66_05325 [Thermococcus sp.]|nr:hypothetical protein [Thermococcus sp.]
MMLKDVWKKFKDEMVDEARKSWKEARERFFLICKKNREVFREETIVGKEKTILAPMKCLEGETVGMFHTHPYGLDIPSKRDIEALIKLEEKPKVYCIAGLPRFLDDRVILTCYDTDDLLRYVRENNLMKMGNEEVVESLFNALRLGKIKNISESFEPKTIVKVEVVEKL